jgi:hypothetical protein
VTPLKRKSSFFGTRPENAFHSPLTTDQRRNSVKVDVDLDDHAYGQLRITREGVLWAPHKNRGSVVAGWREFDVMMRRHRRSQDAARRREALAQKLQTLWASLNRDEREWLVAMAQFQKNGDELTWLTVGAYLNRVHSGWTKNVIGLSASVSQKLASLEEQQPDPPVLDGPRHPRGMMHTPFTREARDAILRRPRVTSGAAGE